MPQLRAFNIAVIALCAALYAVVGYLTSFNLSFGGVAFWPAAFVPAIFAVLFGKWEGGIGAAIGIFIRDVVVIGQPLLSLTAGVTANFAAFFLMGYFAHKKLNQKRTMLSLIIGIVVILAGLLLPTVLLPAESQAFTGLSTETMVILFSVVMAVSLVLFVAITRYWKEFKSFGVGAIIGMAVGAMIVAIGVWAYSQLFYAPGGYFTSPLSSSFATLIFVWTFVTEIPFVLLISPPVAKACRLAFPFLRQNRPTEQKAN
ncbi:MAG: hypothetical protein M1167_00630 [Chloroflexi bacterium]|nr:hypothetical protein [Chloroflexota bacterium]